MVERESAVRHAISAASWLAGRALKEGRAPLAPALHRWCICILEGEQGAGELFGRQRVGTAGDDQLAELMQLAAP